jgi:RNA polymerase sigma-70 factor (ECF subfamily)
MLQEKDRERRSSVALNRNDQLSDLIVETGRGNKLAFDCLIRNTYPTLIKISAGFGEDEQTTLEIYQEALISIWRHAHSFKPAERRPLPWLITVIRSRALDWRRSDKRRASLDRVGGQPYSLEHAGDPLRHLSSIEEESLVWDCLYLMIPAKREVLILYFIDSLSPSQIAFALNTPVPTIKSRIRRGITDLRTIIIKRKIFKDDSYALMRLDLMLNKC